MNTHRAPTREPALTVGAISALVSAVIALLVAFGVDLTEAQTTAILGVVAVVAPIVGAIITRARVTPIQDVVEARAGDRVVAGAGHDTIPVGADIRPVHDD